MTASPSSCPVLLLQLQCSPKISLQVRVEPGPFPAFYPADALREKKKKVLDIAISVRRNRLRFEKTTIHRLRLSVTEAETDGRSLTRCGALTAACICKKTLFHHLTEHLVVAAVGVQ